MPDPVFFGATHNDIHPGKDWYYRYTNGYHGECLGAHFILLCSKPKLLAAHRILCLPTSNKQAFICFMACCYITQLFRGQYQLASVYFTDTV